MLLDLPFIGVGLGGAEDGGGNPGADGAVQSALVHGGDLGVLNAVVSQRVTDDGLDLTAELLQDVAGEADLDAAGLGGLQGDHDVVGLHGAGSKASNEILGPMQAMRSFPCEPYWLSMTETVFSTIRATVPRHPA